MYRYVTASRSRSIPQIWSNLPPLERYSWGNRFSSWVCRSRLHARTRPSSPFCTRNRSEVKKQKWTDKFKQDQQVTVGKTCMTVRSQEQQWTDKAKQDQQVTISKSCMTHNEVTRQTALEKNSLANHSSNAFNGISTDWESLKSIHWQESVVQRTAYVHHASDT